MAAFLTIKPSYGSCYGSLPAVTVATIAAAFPAAITATITAGELVAVTAGKLPRQL